MKPTVLHLIESLVRGGAERRLVNDLKFMDKNRFNHVVAYLFGVDDLKGEILDLGIEVIPLNLKTRFDWVGLKKLLEIVRSKSVDIIHSQLFYADLYARMTKLFIRKIRLISTIQSSYYEPNNDYLYSRKRRLIDSLTGRVCNDRFVAVSEFVRDSIIRRLKFPADRIEVIHNYVDVENFQNSSPEVLQELRRRFSLDDNMPVLITVGRLDPPKGHDYLIEAFAKLIKDNAGLKLLIVGDGPSRRQLEDRVRSLNLQDNIIFTRMRSDVLELLYLADIFVFPTLSEGFPLAVLEAMAVGLPCVASDIGPNREVIESGKTGLLFRAGDLDDLTITMKRLISDVHLAKSLGCHARESVQSRFNPSGMSQKLCDLYTRVLYK